LSKASQIRQKAQELLGKGQIEKAIQEYRRLISFESKNPNLYNELGDIYLRASDKDQAVQNFEKAAVIYEKVALYNNAVAVCKKILRVNTEKTDTIMKLAELRAKQKLEGEAVAFFSQFVESIIASPQTLQRSQKDVERILELMPENEAICAKAAEVYEQLGMQRRTAELYASIAASSSARGDAKKHAQYRRKVEEIKAQLDPQEVAEMQQFESAEAAVCEEPSIESSPARDEASMDVPSESAPSEPDTPSAHAAARAGESEDGSIDEPDEEPARDRSIREAIDEAEMVAAMSQGRVEPQNTPDRRRSAAGASPPGIDAEPRPEASAEMPERRQQAPAPPSGKTQSPDAVSARGGAESESSEFVEEITSDVEKDDLRSHYDLGMAYLEMGLYTESIRDFQIASRCADLQLSAMEMIGYCFLKSGQPRLAVKQLQRALEIATGTNADSLGIHYNLGLAHEMLGETASAREHFEEVYIVDMSFRDVAEKMKKMSSVS
jgi:tetratricopeptide (TPR) repeat protein